MTSFSGVSAGGSVPCAEGSRLVVRVGSLLDNIRSLQRLSGGSRMILPLKANAYGHGAAALARILQDVPDLLLRGFAVARFEEAVQLRENGCRLDLFLLGVDWGLGLRELAAYRVIPWVGSFETLEYWRACWDAWSERERAALEAAPVPIHLNFNTGMNRLGFSASEAEKLLPALERLPGVELKGLGSHLACADLEGPEGDRFTAEAADRFERIRLRFVRAGYQGLELHLVNSMGLLLRRDLLAGWCGPERIIRPGIAMYGYGPARPGNGLIRPISRLESIVLQIRKVRRGEPVSYRYTWSAPEAGYIATVPLGYGDGYPRYLSNRGKVLIGGRIYPVVGLVTMDLLMVFLGKEKRARCGDRVFLLWSAGDLEELGLDPSEPGGGGVFDAEDIALLGNTISYEVLTRFSSRLPRRYID